MIEFPRLKTFLCVFPLSENSWGLRGGADEQWRLKLTDERAMRAFGALLPYLDGRTARPEILRALESAGLHGGAVSAVLGQLEATGLIEEADDHGLPASESSRHESQIRFFSRFTQQGGAKFQAALHRARVGLVADGTLGESVYRRLVEAGFGEAVVFSRDAARAREWAASVSGHSTSTSVHALDPDDPWPATAGALPRVLVVCQEAHEPRLLEAVDALSKRARLPWLLVRTLDLQEGWVGPLFVPGETASYLSLEARLRANMQRFQEYVTFDAHVRANGRPALLGGLRAMCDVLAGVAVVELIKFVTDMKVPEVLGKFLSVNLWTWETELHEVLRVPNLDRPAADRPAVFPWKITNHEDGAASAPRA